MFNYDKSPSPESAVSAERPLSTLSISSQRKYFSARRATLGCAGSLWQPLCLLRGLLGPPVVLLEKFPQYLAPLMYKEGCVKW